MPSDALTLIEKAESIAWSFKHDYLGVEHVFLAALEEGLVDPALASIGATRDASLEALRDQIQPGNESARPQTFARTPRLKRVLDQAMKKALSKNESNFSSAVLLESILEEKNGLVPLSLEALGTSPDKIHALLNQPSSFTASEKDKKKTTPLLDKLGRDLTQMASLDKLDPVIGRSEELRRVMQILTRKTKNVPVLIGEPGVGKTAVVFALAERLAKGSVPAALKGKRVVELPLASLVAGTAHRGEMEDRIQKLIFEISRAPDVIVFIDEIHGIVGAGNTQGNLDIANLFKPALADGSLRVIGASTTEEYQRFLVKDQALERRLQPVLVKEPSEDETHKILEGLKERYEKYHGVSFEEESIEQAIKLSIRYLPDRRLPDKALDLLDEAASRVKNKTAVGPSPVVTREDIAEVTSLWTGIPVQKLTSDEKERFLHLEDELKRRIVAQDEAIQKLCQVVRVSRAGLGNPRRPIGVFFFLGPTGVGKTELAKATADLLYGSADAMVRLDMSEYKEQHTVSKLIGAPPGYIGHEEEGQLTRAVRAKPYSLVLLDEIEKAHPEVFDLFLQIFDDGRLTDSKGRTVSFRNTLIIMTSNIGSSQILADIEKNEERATIQEHVFSQLKSHFRPEFLNRIDEIILFNPLTEKDLEVIVRMQLDELQKKLAEQKLNFTPTPGLIKHLIAIGYEPAYGARPLRRAVEKLLTKPLAEALLQERFEPGSSILADIEGEQIVFKPGGIS